jgi:hypothetical protein
LVCGAYSIIPITSSTVSFPYRNFVNAYVRSIPIFIRAVLNIPPIPSHNTQGEDGDLARGTNQQKLPN